MSRERRRGLFGGRTAGAHSAGRGTKTPVTPDPPPPSPAVGGWSRVLFLGDDEARHALAYTMLARIAASHPADRLVVALRVAPRRQTGWAWTRWLPHTRRPPERPAADPSQTNQADQTNQTPGRPAAMLPELFPEAGDGEGRPPFTPGVRGVREEPLVVVVLDGADLPADDRLLGEGFRNTVVFDLDGRRHRPGRTTLRLDVGADGVRAVWLDGDRGERSVAIEGAAAAAGLVAEASADPGPDGERIGAALDSLAEGGGHPGEWAPPLTAAPTIDHLLPPLVPTPDRGLTTVVPPEGGPLLVPAGIVDLPFERLRDVLRVDLSEHVLIQGEGGSGRSTLLTTLVVALALTNTPREAQFYCLDLDGSLGVLSGLPHTGAVVGRDRVGAVLAKVTALLDHRRELFRAEGVEAMAAYRSRRDEFPDERYGDVFLVIDGEDQDLGEYGDALGRLAADGPGHGIHLLLTTGPGSAPAGLLAGTRVELGPDAPPGRGHLGGSPFLTALPRVDGIESPRGLDEALADLVEEVAEHWGRRPGAPGVLSLPPVVTAGSLTEPEHPLRPVIGISDGELAPVAHDFSTAPHLIVIGDAGSGRTNLLRLIAQSITAGHTPGTARILVVDYRGGLLHAVPEDLVLGNAFSANVLGELVDGTARAIGERRASTDDGEPGDWHGPRLFILVDDYEQVCGQGAGPLEPLREFLPMGYELGAHLVVARSATGAAMADPLLRGLRDGGAATLLLSCPPGEGAVLDGLEPRDLPPGRGMYRARGETALIQTALAG